MTIATDSAEIFTAWRSAGPPTLITAQEARNLAASFGVDLKRISNAVNLASLAVRVAKAARRAAK